ncbi:kelch repeat and BTB domain-containing protein 4 isoform X2 [Rhinoderma darwinii]|uniref:kelch repeat and BTB domain-containing protein 4 isoform X2 n=1 Tax=Rhinoderma darwinii TaxID=43563 RepID=UPI003F67B5AC
MDRPEEAAAQNLASSTEENYFVTYTFTDGSHSSRVAQSIMKLCMEEQLFADVTILVDGKEFQLHRLVLSAQSCFFRSMFASNLKEGRNRVIQLQDVSASVFQLLVDYIYHGTVKLRLEELQETYEVADMYQLISLFQECSRFLVRTVQVKNCLQIMWLSDQHSDTSLYTAAKHCAKTHLSQLCDTEEFLNLPLRMLTDIIADGVPCSQNPTIAIRKWINFNKEERDGFSEMLFSSLKYFEEDIEEAEIEISEEEAFFNTTSEEDEDEDNVTPPGKNFPAPSFLLSRLREAIDAENCVNPWCFQNDPKWGPNEVRPSPTPDTEGRLKNNKWCQCCSCKEMSTVEESTCCKEYPAMERFPEERSCVTEQAQFNHKVLSRENLVCLLMFSTDFTQRKFDHNPHRHLRMAAYRSFSNTIYGFLGKRHKFPIPSCVINKIRDTFPDPERRYTGFK